MTSEGSEADHVVENLPIPGGRILPLNSRRLVSAYLKAIAQSMGLLMEACTDEVRQLIEGQLSEDGREPRNVQVVVREQSEEGMECVCLFLVDDTRIIVETRIESRSEPSHDDESVNSSDSEVGAESAAQDVSENAESVIATLRSELEQKVVELSVVMEDKDRETQRLERELAKERERYKQIWRMSCEQLAEHDTLLAAKDDKIAELQARLDGYGAMPPSELPLADGLMVTRVGTGLPEGTHLLPSKVALPTETVSVGASLPRDFDRLGRGHISERSTTRITSQCRPGESIRGLVLPGTLEDRSEPHQGHRRGKAPPVDAFTGEDPEVRLDDWLPALTHASLWNRWTTEEDLLQLAGHLRGRALQEWGLLNDRDKKNWEQAVAALRSRLDPGNRVIAAQDFRHAMQKETEVVADFIRRLEKIFRIAYSHEQLSQETRDAFLYGQLQDGLRPDLMQSPSVSGALTYKELCMAARNEEQRKAEMRKRRQYRSTATKGEEDLKRIEQRSDTHFRADRTRYGGSNTGNVSTSSYQQGLWTPPKSEPRLCYTCGKPGHMANKCRERKTESQGYSPRRQPLSSARQVTSEWQKAKEVSAILSTLESDSPDSEGVNMICVQDKGSQLRYALVQIQGVHASGLVDSGADITIIGKELFTMIATVSRMKKQELKKPDKIPKTYDRQTFSLNGRMELDIAFENKTITTTVYVKFDAYDQLLLSEGVCHQLGIIQYHPTVKPLLNGKCEGGTKSEDEVRPPKPDVLEEDSDLKVALVPTVRVSLLKSMTILPLKSTLVSVNVDGDDLPGPLLLEPGSLTEEGISVEPSLLEPKHGVTHIRVFNLTGFTRHLEGGIHLGEAMEAVVIAPRPEDREGVSTVCNTEPVSDQTAPQPSVKRVGKATEEERWRCDKVYELFKENLNLPEEKKEHFCEVLKSYHTAFSLTERDRGETDLIQLEIDTGDAPPRKQRPRRLPFAVREEVSRQLKRMQEVGVIRPSNSPWASPVVLVRKKDGSHRFCVDYRELNAVTRKDTFPLPRVDDLLDQLGETRYFSTLDLAAGYWQIRVHPASQAKTVFVTHQGLHEFTVMPFGLTNAPSAFQRVMQQVLMGLNPDNGPDFVSVYIDDVLVFSRTLEEHLEHLKRVLSRLVDVGLKLKPSKCQLKTSRRHIVAVQEFPIPETVKAVRQFMGLTSYYRRFVPGFARIAQPLHALTKKGASFDWTGSCQCAFEDLKKRLCEAPILVYPSFDRKFRLETDASIQGIGAVLSQPQADGKFHPVAFASRALGPAERNYCITDLETLAVVWAVSHFRTYLYGQKVTIYTDHAAVKAVLLNPSAGGRHARWWTKVHGSGIREVQIIYRAGKENTLADALSRNPQGSVPKERLATSEVQVMNVNAEVECSEKTISSLFQAEPAPNPANPTLSLAAEQRKDDSLKIMISFLEDGVLPENPKLAQKVAAQALQFVVLDGVLYLIDSKQQSRKRVAVPTHLKEGHIKDIHSGPLAGHFSTGRIFNALSRSWWWEGMFKDIETHCKSCPQCAIVTGGGRPGRPPLGTIPVSRPFQIFGVDVMDLPRTALGNKHVIVFQDFLTKWPIVFAIPDQKTQRIVKLIVEEIIPVFGVPEALFSDRGTNLLSHLMRDICDLLGIEKINTTAYHPQCNGLTERFNRTLKTMLRKHASRFGPQWDRYLHGVLWAYRNTPHDSTREKPSFLLFGIDCRYPTEAALLPPTSIDEASLEDYRQELILSLSNARTLAAETIQAAQKKYKKYYDRKSKIVKYKLGEWILVRFPQEESGGNRKLPRPWHGPYRVMESDDTGVTASKVYAPDEKSIKIHLSRVTRCPDGFPSGYYWYGSKRNGPGRPPRWVDRLLASSDAPNSEIDDHQTPDQPELEPDETTLTRTRTRKIVPPKRLMNICSGRAK